MVYPALLPLMRTLRLPVVDWTDAPADSNGFVRFGERRNMVSAPMQSHFKRSLPTVWAPPFVCHNLWHCKKSSQIPVVCVCPSHYTDWAIPASEDHSYVLYIIYKEIFRTSQKTECASVSRASRCLLCQAQEHINTPDGKHAILHPSILVLDSPSLQYNRYTLVFGGSVRRVAFITHLVLPPKLWMGTAMPLCLRGMF
jgi:hypothetical protein